MQPTMPTLLQSKPMAVPIRLFKVAPPHNFKEGPAGIATQPAPEVLPEKEPEPEKDPAEVQAGVHDHRLPSTCSCAENDD